MSEHPQRATVFVTGAGGQLACELAEQAPRHRDWRFVFLSIDDLDITDPAAVRERLRPAPGDLIINAAAYTAVDRAETEPELARAVNALGPKHLAERARATGCLLLHVSTDYVFDGERSRPHREDDPTAPLNVYGRTKLEGEQAVLASGARAVVVRTSWLYSSFGSTFANTMLRLGRERDEVSVVYEQTGSPTYARDLAEVLLTIPRRLPPDLPLPQIYHYANEGNVSWYDFAQAIMELGNCRCRVRPIEIAEYPLPAPRPVNGTLHKGKIKRDFGIRIPYWRDSLRDCLDRIRQNEL